jgi:hypothetical protein
MEVRSIGSECVGGVRGIQAEFRQGSENAEFRISVVGEGLDSSMAKVRL